METVSKLEGEQKKKYIDVFKPGGNILGRSVSNRYNKLFIIEFPHFKGNLSINNLFNTLKPSGLRGRS